MRQILLVIILLFSLDVGSAEAIVAACPNGFNNCDPYTGVCYRDWLATLNGQLQAQCSANPAACWQQSLTSPACDDPVPPPANPNALRVCPWGADCGVGYPPHALDQIDPSRRATAGTMVFYYQGHPFPPFPPCCDPPTIDVNFVMDCKVYTIQTGLIAPGCDWTGRIVSSSFATFEPAPTCGWNIVPRSPVQPCVLPQALAVATFKDNATQWTGISNYFKNVQARANRMNRGLATGRYGNPLSSRYAAASRRFAWLDELLTLLAQLISDPPNANYQTLPGPSTAYPLVGLPAPDGTMTQTELTQLGAWLTALRETIIVARQLTDTIDNLSGAIVAAESGTPGAATWARVLALHADAVSATLAQKGALEVAARAGVTSASIAEDAYCSTPTDSVNLLKTAVQNGSTLYQGHLVYAADPVCDVAGSYPAWLTQDAPSANALWASLSSLGLATYLCSHGGYCARFADVPTTHPFFSYIEAISKAGITAGCAVDPPMYCPDTVVTRDQMAVFLLRGMHGSGFQPPPATGTMFADVPISRQFANWIEQFAREGITAGCGGGNYCPGTAVTRDQMAVFMLRAKHGAGYAPPAATGMFTDVPLSHPFVKWIEQFAREGITGGCGGGNYCPSTTVTRGQMAVFIQRTFSLGQ